MKSISVYYKEANITLEAAALKIVDNKAVVLLQDRIHVAELISGVWTISSANKCVLDLFNLI